MIYSVDSWLTQAYSLRTGCRWKLTTQTSSSFQRMYVPWVIVRFIGRSFLCPQVKCLISPCGEEASRLETYSSTDNYHFNSSAGFSSLLIGVPFACPCSCHVSLHARQLGTQDLRFPSQQGWPAHQCATSVCYRFGVCSLSSCHLCHH